MKKLRSSDDLNSIGDKGLCRDSDSNRTSSSYRGYYYKSDNGRKGLSSSYTSRYDRSVDEERDSSRSVRKRSSYHSENFDRRKGFDRYRDCGSDRGGSLVSSLRGGYGGDRIHRSESFCAPRRDFPKGFRSERDRSRREGSVSSWTRFGGNKEFDDGGKSSSDSIRGSRSGLEDRGRGLRDAKSPAWSKDSVSDQSKSAEVKKGEEVPPVESGGSSEMEEGELEPELEPVGENKSDNEVKADNGLDHDHEGLENREVVEETVMEDGARPLPKEKQLKQQSVSEPEVGVFGSQPSKEKACEGKLEAEPSEIAEDVAKEVNRLLDCQKKLTDGVDGCRDILSPDAKHDEVDNSFREVEVREDTAVDKCFLLLEENKEVNGIVPEVQAENNDMQETGREFSRENGILGLKVLTDELTQDLKEKGKSVSFLSSDIDASTGGEACMKGGLKDSLSCREDDDWERPSTRGFELFSSPLVKKPERTDKLDVKKLKDEKLTLEPLDLSLSLPNVLLPISSCDLSPATGGARSMNSQLAIAQAGSSTASMSFAGSQQISHNPSCSLTQNSLDNYELSVGSRPIFQGVDQDFHATWQGQSPHEPKQKEIPLYQRILMNGNGVVHQPFASQGLTNGQVTQSQHLRLSQGSSKVASVLDRQLSLNKQLAGVQARHHNEVVSPTQSIGSLETGSEHSKDRKQMVTEKNGGSVYRFGNEKENEQVLRIGADFVETMITMIVSEPIHVTATKFQEMTEQSLACLREGISGMLVNAGKHGQRSALPKSPQKWSDITLDMLLNCPRAQLEIMVSLKTGLNDFLQQCNTVPASVLAEIFLDLRCRNLNCRSHLPVDECNCKICARMNGFCNSCMCVLCSKFDLASNTCSWVGCDACLHWCHTDCGLRESLIRNGHSVSNTQGMSEMQFHCAACGHPSEMYGFIKDVFQNFVETWPEQTLMKELKYVMKIFCASKDVRGKYLHDIAEQMLSRLANGSDLPNVYNRILNFLLESGTTNYGNVPILSGKEQGEGSNKMARWGQETMGLDSVYSEKASQLERTTSIPPRFECGRNDKDILNSEFQSGSLKEPLFDELESIVRIKQAEAKMFQAHADDARREAEGLKRIAIAKNDKIEEEFASRIAKLRLVEAEQMRKQKLEQLQALERAHREYFNMKMRMEADIKDLLLKMEATKQNLAR